MGRLEESKMYCRRIFDMERNRRILPFETANAHLIFMNICKSEGRPVEEQLEHSWAAIDATTTIGDENSCIAYTTILENTEEADK